MELRDHGWTMDYCRPPEMESCGDCVTRAVTNVVWRVQHPDWVERTLPATYKHMLNVMGQAHLEHARRIGRRPRKQAGTAGVYWDAATPIFEEIGFTKYAATGPATMIKKPSMIRSSRHIAAVIDGMFVDTYDSRRQHWRSLFTYQGDVPDRDDLPPAFPNGVNEWGEPIYPAPEPKPEPDRFFNDTHQINIFGQEGW